MNNMVAPYIVRLCVFMRTSMSFKQPLSYMGILMYRAVLNM